MDHLWFHISLWKNKHLCKLRTDGSSMSMCLSLLREGVLISIIKRFWVFLNRVWIKLCYMRLDMTSSCTCICIYSPLQLYSVYFVTTNLASRLKPVLRDQPLQTLIFDFSRHWSDRTWLCSINNEELWHFEVV